MHEGEPLHISVEEARGLMLAAQALLHPPAAPADLAAVRALVERLGVVQIDTISVVERSQYLVLWSRLGAYDPSLLDALLYPERAVLEYWCHAASIVPMRDYPYHRAHMLHYADHMWDGHYPWMRENADVLRETLEAVRARGPLASADFERPPGAARTGPWDWHGPKPSRRALEILWTTGELMIHSRRAGQKLYDLRERVLAEVFGETTPRDADLPSAEERRRYFIDRTVEALGVVAPSWLWDYFRLTPAETRQKRQAATAALARLAARGSVIPATVEGLAEPVYVARDRLDDLAWLRAGHTPARTTLLSPFDSLIWDRARARALFDYEVVFEAYVPPPKRRYGYYCLAILHHGRLEGRLDLKMDRAAGQLLVRALHLEPGIVADEALLDGLADALRDLARFLGGERVVVAGDQPGPALALAERLRGYIPSIRTHPDPA